MTYIRIRLFLRFLGEICASEQTLLGFGLDRFSETGSSQLVQIPELKPMSETKKRSTRATGDFLTEKSSQQYLIPETAIRELARNLSVGQAHDAAMCLLVIEEAVRSIENRSESRDLNLRLIKRIVTTEGCRPIQSIVEAIIDAIGQGAEGMYASCLTITRFLEFAFGYQPDQSRAERLYKSELRKIRRSTESGGN